MRLGQFRSKNKQVITGSGVVEHITLHLLPDKLLWESKLFTLGDRSLIDVNSRVVHCNLIQLRLSQ